MDIKINKKKLQQLWNACSIISGLDLHPRLAYAVSRTKKLIADDIDAFVEASKPTLAYEAAIESLEKDHGIKNEKGAFVRINGKIIPKDQDKYDQALKELKKTTGQKEREEEIEKLFTEEISVKVHMVDIKYFPENIKGYLMDGLLPMVYDSDDQRTE